MDGAILVCRVRTSFVRWYTEFMPTEIVERSDDMEALGGRILASLSPCEGATVLALHGNLGAGKTTLTQAIARSLGVTDTVRSPTFVILQTYPLHSESRFTTLTHIDAYRIDDEEELRVLGWAELLTDPGRLIVIEWPERVLGLIPPSAIHVHIEIGKDTERIISYG